MGSSSSIFLLLVRCFFSFSVLLLCHASSQLCNAHNRSEFEKVIHHLRHKRNHIKVQIGSLLEQDSCKHSPKGNRGGGPSLQVVHMHGPCSKLKSHGKVSNGRPSHEDILQQDQYRVDSIQVQCAGWWAPFRSKRSANMPVKSGSLIGSGNYFVTVGLGTPKKLLSLVFDTGSDLTWTQCEPCAESCYVQVDPRFDPAASSTYTNISCTSTTCSDLVAATGVKPGCSSSTCVYRIKYGDSSSSVGLFARERLTLTSTEYIDNFLFGCGENNQGLFAGSAGLLGLGRNKLSLVSQAAYKYGKYFSYCLPVRSSATGHLTVGRGGTRATRFTYTPILTSSKNPSFYFVSLQAIELAGRIIPIPSAVFTSSGTIIDSGTVITRLSPRAYAALRAAFRSFMSARGYPRAPAFSILDSCYDLSKYQSVSVPKVALIFMGPAVMDLDVSGILFVIKASQVCLAFAGNSDSSDTSIIGNVQQQTFDIVYDVDGGKIGFGHRGC